MPSQLSFGQQRLASLAAWATEIHLPGMEQETYLKILEYVIHEQQSNGAWSMQGKETWDTVLTSVVLKSLADLQFKINDSWTTRQKKVGGVSPAVQFVTKAVKLAGGSPERVDEDIWDACQAALALAEFGSHDIALPMVRSLNQDWEKLYERACDATNRWCGPAYLAAIIDVIGRYE